MPNPMMLTGYKTYIVSALVVLIGLVEGPMGIDIPGVDTGDSWLNYVIAGAFGGTFRSALKSFLPN